MFSVMKRVMFWIYDILEEKDYVRLYVCKDICLVYVWKGIRFTGLEWLALGRDRWGAGTCRERCFPLHLTAPLAFCVMHVACLLRTNTGNAPWQNEQEFCVGRVQGLICDQISQLEV